jgi:hypothetical protein
VTRGPGNSLAPSLIVPTVRPVASVSLRPAAWLCWRPAAPRPCFSGPAARGVRALLATGSPAALCPGAGGPGSPGFAADRQPRRPCVPEPAARRVRALLATGSSTAPVSRSRRPGEPGPCCRPAAPAALFLGAGGPGEPGLRWRPAVRRPLFLGAGGPGEPGLRWRPAVRRPLFLGAGGPGEPGLRWRPAVRRPLCPGAGGSESPGLAADRQPGGSCVPEPAARVTLGPAPGTRVLRARGPDYRLTPASSSSF